MPLIKVNILAAVLVLSCCGHASGESDECNDTFDPRRDRYITDHVFSPRDYSSFEVPATLLRQNNPPGLFLTYILRGWSRQQCELHLGLDPRHDKRLQAKFDDPEINRHVTSIDCTWFGLDDGRCVAFDTELNSWQRCKIHTDD